jgi:hypothetical protein
MFYHGAEGRKDKKREKRGEKRLGKSDERTRAIEVLGLREYRTEFFLYLQLK